MAQGEQDKTEAAPNVSAASRLAAKRAAKAAAKAAKRATGPVPNEVAVGVRVARSWYENNVRLVWLGLGAGALLGIAWVSISAHLAKQGREAADVLATAVTAANAPIVAAGEEAPEDAQETFSSVETRAQKARDEFAKVLSHAPTDEAQRWARVGEANALEQLGKHAGAQRTYKRVLAGGEEGSTFVRMLALEGLGFSLEADKKYAEAATRFEQISALADGAYRPVGEYHRARMLIAQGKSADAAKALEALVKAERARPAEEGARFPELMSDAQTLLDELAVQLDQPKLRADVGAGSNGGLSQNIINALRGKLAAGKGEPVLDEKTLKQLEQQVDHGSKPAPGAPVQEPASPAPKDDAK